MSDHERPTEPADAPEQAAPAAEGVVVPFPETRAPEAAQEGDVPFVSPRIRWLRLVALMTGLGVLASVSTVFGMMMAVASDLPALDVLDVANNPSELYDTTGKVRLGPLTGNQRRILVRSDEIAPAMKHAIVSIEDRRFYTNSGVDVRGIGRALYQDILTRKIVQGGSTITQQLVKNRLEASDDRTLFQKLRESAIAFHMTEKWDKQKILTNYLNTIYFGNGAYGIESAARTYFGSQHVGCGDQGARKCAEQLEPHEAALIAGVVASPSGYDPIARPAAARDRRDLVLLRMLELGYISRTQFESSRIEPVPTAADIAPPSEESRFPYFTTWVRQQVVDTMGVGPAFEGGLRVKTTIDVPLQEAAERAVATMPAGGPSAAMVAIDNRTSEVVALVGGAAGQDAYNERPFNLATQGQRQPGSAFKPFTLAEALRQGKARADTTFESKKKFFCVTRRRGKCRETFEVNNYDDNYAGITTLAQATSFSDNSVYAELGVKTGTPKIAKLARQMGVRTKVSRNFAITLGGLREGVTVLDMAHAYQTMARDGRLSYGTLSPGADDRKGIPGPVGIRSIEKLESSDGERRRYELARTVDGEKARNRPQERKALYSSAVSQEIKGMLASVVRVGTGKRASLGPDDPVYGKTGTTEDYGDAWFVGWTKEYTVAVWIGFPDRVTPMKPPVFSYQGEPVAGGTYPAAIFSAFMRQALTIADSRKKPDQREREAEEGPTPPTGPSAPAVPAPSATAPPAPTTAPGGGGGPGSGGGGTAPPNPPQPQPQSEPSEPAPAPAKPNPTVAPQEPPPEDPGSGGANSP